MKMKIQHTKIYGMQQKHYKEGSLQQYRPTLKKQEKSQSNLTAKETIKRKTKGKVSRMKEIIKIRAEIHKIESKRTVEKINELSAGSSKTRTKFGKPLARLTKKKREKVLINKIKQKAEITTDIT